ncbi:unnamed protein product [Dicrocoelium dendriticum]|nr:unnamed protein product [Dicrocoelium dendriticum]
MHSPGGSAQAHPVSSMGFVVPVSQASVAAQQASMQLQVHQTLLKPPSSGNRQRSSGTGTSERGKRKSRSKVATPTMTSSASSFLAPTIPSTASVTSCNTLTVNGDAPIAAMPMLNSINCNSLIETSVSPLPSVLSPLPTLPEEILLKIDPSLGDPPPPPHADITASKPYQCDQCLKRYSGMKSLKNHKLTHSDIKPHKCSVCGKAFLRADKMRLHEISHLNVKPFECATCKQRFTRSDKLKIHHRTHTGVRPYACTFCPKRFTRSDKLKIHERIHTKIKPYECVHCGKCFARSDKRRLHERTHLYGPRPRAITGGSGRKSKSNPIGAVASSGTSAVDKSFILNSTTFSCSDSTALSTLSTIAAAVGSNAPNVFSPATAFGLASIAGSAAATFVNPLGFQPSNSLTSVSVGDTSQKVEGVGSSSTGSAPCLTASFPFPIPSGQHLHFPPQHHSTFASLAGIAQYHPALFAAQQPRHMAPSSTLAVHVPFYQQQQQHEQAAVNQNTYQATQMMPFFVGTTNSTASTLTPFIGPSTMSSVEQCTTASSAIGQLPSGTVTSNHTYPAVSVSRSSSVANDSIGPASATGNIAAVMAAAALGRQLHQNQQQQTYQTAAAVNTSPAASAFLQPRPQQQNQQLFNQNQTIKQELQHPIKQDPQQPQQAASVRSGFQFYQTQFMPSMVPSQYSQHPAAHHPQQSYMQVQHHHQQQQQQQYLAAAAALTLTSSGSDTQSQQQRPSSTADSVGLRPKVE